MRKPKLTVWVDNIPIGGGHPVVIQSMTDTPTEDPVKTARQVRELYLAGSELVRITVNSEKSAKMVPEIKKRLEDEGIPVPLIGDFHFNGHKLLKAFPSMAKTLSKFRINPGTLGGSRHKDDNFDTFIHLAKDYNKPIRIGVNWGSVDPYLLKANMDANARLEKPKSAQGVLLETCVQSALISAERAELLGLPSDKIILSVKVSEVKDLLWVNRQLAQRCHYPLHLGLTEAGMGDKGLIASVVSLGILLEEGIGDTLRISLTPEPQTPRTREVEVARWLLQVMDLRKFQPTVTACPGCGRTGSSFFQELAFTIQEHIRKNLIKWRERYPGVENLTIAVMGCVVNGPGEASHADIGISLPGRGESPKAPVYIEGKLAYTLKGDHIAEQFIYILEDFLEKRFSRESSDFI